MKETENPIHSFIIDCRAELSEILQNKLLDESSLIRFARDRGIAVSGVVEGDPSQFLKLGWIESDELHDAESTLFHPFRIYPLHLAVESCRLNISPSSSINREGFGDFLFKVKDLLPSIDRISENAKLANEIANMAMILEPIYWPTITSKTTWNGFVTFEEHKNLMLTSGVNIIRSCD